MELLTEHEAAALAKVHPRTIRRLIDKGILPAVNYGMGSKKIYRINAADLGTVQPVAKPAGPQRRQRRNPVVNDFLREPDPYVRGGVLV